MVDYKKRVLYEYIVYNTNTVYLTDKKWFGIFLFRPIFLLLVRNDSRCISGSYNLNRDNFFEYVIHEPLTKKIGMHVK